MTIDQDFAAKYLLIEIRKIAEQYGGRIKSDDAIIGECVKLTLNNFKLIGIEEVREAFRAYASGLLEVNAEMYGGVFNVAVFGKVLSGWVEYRRKVIDKYLKIQQAAQQEENERRKEEFFKSKHDQEFENWIAKGKAEYKTWEDVPEWFYDTATRLKYLKIGKEEAIAIFDEAKKIAAMQKEEERGQIAMMKDARRLTAKGFDIEARQKTIARKIAVFRKLINHE